VASVGIEMGLAVVVGWGIGYWLDRKFDTAPYLMLLFLLIGSAAGFKGLFRAAKEARSASDDSTAASKDRTP
jgi:ATP synthase protein I